MNDMTSVIVPKSDQINADDLIAGPRTITINDVQIRGGQEQPVSIFFDGSDKAFRPCKSMSRVLVAAWGADAKAYVGRSLTLYRDPSVKWGGMEVGGIRISHMTNIDGKLQLALTATKGQRKPYIVMPLTDVAQQTDKAAEYAAEQIAAIEASDADALDALIAKQTRGFDKLRKERPELAASVDAAIEARRSTFGNDGYGETHSDPASDTVTRIRGLIESAADKVALDLAEAEYKKHMMALPAEDAGALEDVLNAAKERVA